MELAPSVRRDMQKLAEFAQTGADRQAQIDRVVEFATGKSSDAAALNAVTRETGLTPAQVLRVVAHYHEDMLARDPASSAMALTDGANRAGAAHDVRPAGQTLALKGFAAPLSPKADVEALWAQYEKTQTVSAELAARFLQAVVHDGVIDLAELNKLREMVKAPDGAGHSPAGKKLVELLVDLAEATFEARSQRAFSFILGPRQVDAVGVSDLRYTLDRLGTPQSVDAFEALRLGEHPIDKNDAAQAQRFQRFVEAVQGGELSVYGAMVELDTFSPERVALGVEAVVRQVRSADDVRHLLARVRGTASEPFRLTAHHMLTMLTNPGVDVAGISDALGGWEAASPFTRLFGRELTAILNVATPQDLRAVFQAKSMFRHALAGEHGAAIFARLRTLPDVTVAQRAELLSLANGVTGWNIRSAVDELLVEAKTQEDVDALAKLTLGIMRFARTGEDAPTSAVNFLRTLIERGVSAEAVFEQVDRLTDRSLQARPETKLEPQSLANVLGDLAARGDLSASASRRLVDILYRGADPRSAVAMGPQPRAMVLEKLLSRGAELPYPESDDGKRLSQLILSFPFEQQQTFTSLYRDATYRYGTLVGQHLHAISAAIVGGQSSLMITLDKEAFEKVAAGDDTLALASMQAHLQRLYREHRPQVKLVERGASVLRLEVSFHPVPRHETRVNVNVTNSVRVENQHPGTFFGWLSGTNPKRRKS